MQKTVASDIAPQATTSHHFTHSSNTPTRTRHIVTTSHMEPSEPMITSSPLMRMDLSSIDDFPVSEENDPPAGVEVLTKPRRYVNSV